MCAGCGFTTQSSNTHCPHAHACSHVLSSAVAACMHSTAMVPMRPLSSLCRHSVWRRGHMPLMNRLPSFTFTTGHDIPLSLVSNALCCDATRLPPPPHTHTHDKICFATCVLHLSLSLPRVLYFVSQSPPPSLPACLFLVFFSASVDLHDPQHPSELPARSRPRPRSLRARVCLRVTRLLTPTPAHIHAGTHTQPPPPLPLSPSRFLFASVLFCFRVCGSR